VSGAAAQHPELEVGPASPRALPATLRADLLARYPEAAGWSFPRKVLKFLSDPSLQAVLTMRLVLITPGRFLWMWRTWDIARFRCEFFRIEIGPGAHLPHPANILIGPGTRLGRGVTIHNNVNIGFARAPEPGKRMPCPTIEDEVEIGTGSWIVGAITVGEGARLAPGAFVTRDVPPGAVVETHPSLTGGDS
jgi:serine acetyltransferase